MANLCIIPARGGSKRIPRKNIKPFLGKPIIAYSIQAALDSGLFEEVMVSTEDEEIAQAAREYGASVPFLRNPDTADDFSGLADVALEVMQRYQEQGLQWNHLAVILPTAPLLSSDVIGKAGELLESGKGDSVLTVTEYSYPIQRSLRKTAEGTLEMRWPEHQASRSQDLEPTYHDAGQLYYMPVNVLEEQKTLFTRRTLPLVLEGLAVQDIDNETDWALAEMKYRLINE